jgi:hypothetical protein
MLAGAPGGPMEIRFLALVRLREILRNAISGRPFS